MLKYKQTLILYEKKIILRDKKSKYYLIEYKLNEDCERAFK